MMKNWKDVKTGLLKNEAVANEYEAQRPYYELASQLIEARLKKGLSQADLAKRIGTKQSAIARIESGAANISVSYLEKVADAIGIQLEIRFIPRKNKCA